MPTRLEAVMEWEADVSLTWVAALASAPPQRGRAARLGAVPLWRTAVGRVAWQKRGEPLRALPRWSGDAARSGVEEWRQLAAWAAEYSARRRLLRMLAWPVERLRWAVVGALVRLASVWLPQALARTVWRLARSVAAALH
ncbi:MAG: hypothetical protein LBU76_11480 [Azoarcus sp.]|nr:hypothetical protein [Azoarcus sp.]